MAANIHELYEKTTKVVNSCEDYKQLQGAINYASLFVQLLERHYPDKYRMKSDIWRAIQNRSIILT